MRSALIRFELKIRFKNKYLHVSLLVSTSLSPLFCLSYLFFNPFLGFFAFISLQIKGIQINSAKSLKGKRLADAVINLANN